jgi:hypothetical protein
VNYFSSATAYLCWLKLKLELITQTLITGVEQDAHASNHIDDLHPIPDHHSVEHTQQESVDGTEDLNVHDQDEDEQFYDAVDVFSIDDIHSENPSSDLEMDSAEPQPFSSVQSPELELGSHEPLAHTPMATSHLSEQSSNVSESVDDVHFDQSSSRGMSSIIFIIREICCDPFTHDTKPY